MIEEQESLSVRFLSISLCIASFFKFIAANRKAPKWGLFAMFEIPYHQPLRFATDLLILL